MRISYCQLLVAVVLAGCSEAAAPQIEVAPPRRAEGSGRAIAEYQVEKEAPPAPVAAARTKPVKVRRPGRAAPGERPQVARRHAGGQDVTRIDDVDGKGGDAILPPGIVRYVMQSHFRSLVPCALAERRRARSLAQVTIDFGIRGTGQVGPVAVNGLSSGPLQSCIRGQMRSLRFPTFDGALTRARFSMSVQ